MGPWEIAFLLIMLIAAARALAVLYLIIRSAVTAGVRAARRD
jgi:hypothetical protein